MPTEDETSAEYIEQLSKKRASVRKRKRQQDNKKGRKYTLLISYLDI